MIRRWLALTYYLYALRPCLIFILIHYKIKIWNGVKGGIIVKSIGFFYGKSSLHGKRESAGCFLLCGLFVNPLVGHFVKADDAAAVFFRKRFGFGQIGEGHGIDCLHAADKFAFNHIIRGFGINP